MRASAPPSAAEYGLGQMRTTGSAVPAAMTPPQKGVFHAPRVMSAAARAASRFAWGTRSSAKTTSPRSEEHTSELQSRLHLVCRLLLEKKKKQRRIKNDQQGHHD